MQIDCNEDQLFCTYKISKKIAMRIQIKTLLATVGILAMLVGSANAQELTMDGFEMDTTSFNGYVMEINIGLTESVQINKGDKIYLGVYGQELMLEFGTEVPYNTSNTMLYFGLNQEEYDLFIANGFDYVSINEEKYCYFDKGQRDLLMKFSKQKSTFTINQFANY